MQKSRKLRTGIRESGERPSAHQCPLWRKGSTLRCDHFALSKEQFLEHLLSDHIGAVMEEKLHAMISHYACAFFNADSSADVMQFGQYCTLCASILQSMGVEPKHSRVKPEVAFEHISAHFSLPKFACLKCVLLLPSTKAAESHSKCKPTVCNSEDILSDFPEPSVLWRTFFSHVNAACESALEKARKEVPEWNPEKILHFDDVLATALRHNPPSLCCLRDLGPDPLAVVYSFGHSTVLSRLIFSSPRSQVEEYLNVLAPHFGELIEHRLAARPTAALMIYASREQESQYINAIAAKVASLRESILACHAFRGLATHAGCSDRMQGALSAVLLGNPCAPIEELRKWNALGLILSCAVARDSASSREIARMLSESPDSFCTFVRNEMLHDAMRSLIQLACQPSNFSAWPEYRALVREAVAQLNDYFNDIYGNMVAQCVLHFGPKQLTSKCSFIDNIFHIDRFLEACKGHGNYVLQTALHIAVPSKVDAFVFALSANGQYLREILSSLSGIHVYRSLVESIVSFHSIAKLRKLTYALHESVSGEESHLPRTVALCAKIVCHRQKQLAAFYNK